MSRTLPTFVLLCLLSVPTWAGDPPIPKDGPEVKTTKSGLKYSVLKEGAKGPSPKLGESVIVHYTGWLENGKVFDSSRGKERPAKFVLGEVIPGWNEGLQLMTSGARFKFWIPSKLAYGARGFPPDIGPNQNLIFDVELLNPNFTAGDPEKQKSTESGIVYEPIRAGKGELCGKDDVYELRFALWTKKGKLLRCTEEDGMTLKGTASASLLPFLKEVPFLLRVGDRFRFEVPPALCFGANRQGADLPPNSTTVWELELVRVRQPLPLPAFPAEGEWRKTDSGLEYRVLKKAEKEGRKPKIGDVVRVHYAGWFTNKKVFDSSFSRAEPTEFVLGRVIPGWNEGLQLMQPGDVFVFRIPGRLGYGSRGNPPTIPPDATLIFHVELIGIPKRK